MSLLYTAHLSSRLADQERTFSDLYSLAQLELNDFDDEDIDMTDITLHLKILQGNSTIPVVIVDDDGTINYAVNFGSDLDSNKVYLKSVVEELDESGFQPIDGYDYKVYYRESNLLRQFRIYPYLQLVLVAAFILFGYLMINAARRSEQNRVWVGMAKETAHQLGTPITAIVAWLEHLRDLRSEDEEVKEVVVELQADVDRLQLIADRFSKIGAAPVLKEVNLYWELERCRVYMQRRAPRRVAFDFPDPEMHKQLSVRINAHLFDWVIENLLRNALDAMGGKGKISCDVYEDKEFAYIDLMDTGHGIPSNKFKSVFKPGYTTKKRGWGLGLSLAKRIIEEYHSGKIFVKSSTESEGTTFTIALPKSTIG